MNYSPFGRTDRANPVRANMRPCLDQKLSFDLPPFLGLKDRKVPAGRSVDLVCRAALGVGRGGAVGTGAAALRDTDSSIGCGVGCVAAGGAGGRRGNLDAQPPLSVPP